MMKFEDIETGKSYACFYTLSTQQDVTESFGLIKTRDVDNQLVEVIDIESKERHIVHWDDCRGLDEVEWDESN
jgi:hypothetical protein